MIIIPTIISRWRVAHIWRGFFSRHHQTGGAPRFAREVGRGTADTNDFSFHHNWTVRRVTAQTLTENQKPGAPHIRVLYECAKPTHRKVRGERGARQSRDRLNGNCLDSGAALARVTTNRVSVHVSSLG
jgi:hypothetical protein